MSLKIINPYFRTPAQITAEEMNIRVATAMQANAAAIGQAAGIAEIRGVLTPADKALFTPAVFRALCVLNSWGITEDGGD